MRVISSTKTRGISQDYARYAFYVVPVVVILLIIIAFTPRTAFAATETYQDYPTTPGTCYKFELANMQSSNHEVFIGAPGKEKRWSYFYQAVTPFNSGCTYRVPDGQYTTRVKIISHDNVSPNTIRASMNFRYMGTNLSAYKYDNHYGLAGDVVALTDTTATITGSGFGIYWGTYQQFTNWRLLYSEDPNFAERGVWSDSVAYGYGWEGDFTTTLTGLKPNTTYYYQAASDFRTTAPGISGHLSVADAYTEVRSFTTSAPALQPKVYTGDPENVTMNSASIVNNTYADFNGQRIYWEGDIYSTDPNISWYWDAQAVGTGTPFSTDLSNLQPETTYYYRAYVYSEQGFFYGEIKQFTTPAAPQPLEPKVITGDPIDVTMNSAKIINNEYENIDRSTIFMVGDLCSTDPNLDWYWQENLFGNDIQTPYAVDFSNLEPGTTYYYRAWVYSTKGIFYGEIKQFTTPAPQPPLVVTGDAIDVTTNSATIKDNTYDRFDGHTILVIGNLYGTDPTLTTNDMSFTISIKTPFSRDLTGLQEDTKYYYRAFVYTDQGFFYGEIKEFTTLKKVSNPVVVTGNHTKVTGISATIADNTYADFDGLTILEVGNEYARNMAMTTNLVRQSAVGTNTPFDTDLSGLTRQTMYYYRAYVLTDQGYYYGAVKFFISGSSGS